MTRAQMIWCLKDLSQTWGADVPEFTLHALHGITEPEIAREFGSWNEFRAAAGLIPQRPKRKRGLTSAQLIARLKELAKKQGPEVSLHTFLTEVGCSEKVVVNRFGRWSQLRVAAGLTPFAKMPARYTEEDMLEDLWQVYQRTGQEPKRFQHRREGGRISSQTMVGRFGSWEEVKRAFATWRRGKES
jgi:hypothetical protein